jgi:hypothetical protein
VLALQPYAWLDGRLRRWSVVPPGPRGSPLMWQVWLTWLRSRPWPRPAPPSARIVRSLIIVAVLLGGSAYAGASWLRQARSPEAVVQAYYDDLDFRRFADAYARLDPVTRPDLETYLVNLSLRGGLVASYGKLDSVRVTVLRQGEATAEVEARLLWVTALDEYPTVERLAMARRDGIWYVVPRPVDVEPPPDLFVRRPTLEWLVPDARDRSDTSDLPPPVVDRPDLELRSARLVRVGDRFSVVGEIANVDVDPADTTVTALLYDRTGAELSRYNAQTAMLHKLLPGELTPFRVDFEGVAGAAITETLRVGEFRPGDFTPLDLRRPVEAFAVYGKGVATSYELRRDVGAQELRAEVGPDGAVTLRGALFNAGTLEATIPQVLVTCYDASGRVVWVEELFVEAAVLPQERRPFELTLTVAGEVELQDAAATLFPPAPPDAPRPPDLLVLPPGAGYAALRVSVNAFVGAGP